MPRRHVGIKLPAEMEGLFLEAQNSGNVSDFFVQLIEKGSQGFREGAAGRPAPLRENAFQFGSEYQAPESQESPKHSIYGFQRYCYEEGCNEENKNFLPATIACSDCGMPRARIDLRASDLDDRLKELPDCPVCGSSRVVKGEFELSRAEWMRLKGSD